MTDQDRKRINDFIEFLRSSFRYMTWTGLGLIGVGLIIGLTANGSVFFKLCPGFIFIGGVLVLRFSFLKMNLPKVEEMNDPDYFQNEIDQLVSRIKFFSFFLIVSVMLSILVTFVSQWRILIPTLIFLILYVVSEYIVWIIVRFRIEILKQEIKIEP